MIQQAIRTVFVGDGLLDPSVQRRLLERALGGPANAPPGRGYPDGLTQREAGLRDRAQAVVYAIRHGLAE